MAEGNPVEAIRIAANLGGDCDTIASIAGRSAEPVPEPAVSLRTGLKKLRKLIIFI